MCVFSICIQDIRICSSSCTSSLARSISELCLCLVKGGIEDIQGSFRGAEMNQLRIIRNELKSWLEKTITSYHDTYLYVF